MIVWINGAFGAGKTQTAFELHRRIPNSFVFDPENAGYYIRKNVPSSAMRDDFQDFPMWRETNYGMLKYIDASYDGVVLVPMTVVNPGYFAEMAGRLRSEGVVVHHFALCASKDVLLRRLRSRGDGERSWAARQIDRCIEGLRDETFRHHLDTDGWSVSDNAERIAALARLELLPDDRSAWRKSWDRLRTQWNHIRFFQ
ncbi:AAA family ATPase [Paenibacillus sp.]|uniref:AAA family ATPase n=1 Tax=Paenibacillus sp. TaxID=58172 RepID=UPI002810BFA5|nr:AAA family ATPase [Paenibacillus sp.]